MSVAAILVTRGDVPLDRILAELGAAGFDETIVWDNSRRDTDLAVYGRYAAIADTTAECIYVQDDDCVIEPDAIQQLIDLHVPGHVVCNQPEPFRHPFYREHALVGFGAVFDRDLPAAAFARFAETHSYAEVGERFYRTCDIVFTALTPHILADVPYRNLEHAHASNRMWKQDYHLAERTATLEEALLVRDRAAA